MPKKLEDCTTEELIAQIRALRKENADRRGAVSTYDEAFNGLDPTMQRGLLRMVKVFSDDREAGAALFRQVADSILSPEGDRIQLEEEVDPMTDTNPLGEEKPSPEGDPNVAALLEHVKKLEETIVELQNDRKASAEAEEARQRDEAIAYLNQLGYQQGTPEWDNIIELASSDLLNGDLDRAHKLYNQFYPAVEGEGQEGQGQEGQEQGQQSPEQNGQSEGSQQEEGGETKFPATVGRGSVGGPHLDPSAGQDVDLSRAATDQRAREYLENLMASQA